MHRQRKQFIAVIAILVIFIGAYVGMHMYNNKQEKKTAAKEEADKTYITKVKAEDITAFSYQYSEGTLTFTKADDTWSCKEDENVDIDESKVTTLLGNLENLEAEEIVENPEDLSDYGFDTPTNVITFTTEEGTTTLTVGMENSIISQYYVSADSSEKLYLVSTAMPEAFQKPLQDLVTEDTETEQPQESVQTAETEQPTEEIKTTEVQE